MTGGNQSGLPFDPPDRDGPPQAHALDLDPRAGQVLQVVHPNGRDTEAFLGFGHHELFGRQTRQRLPDCARADMKARTDFVNLELPAGPQPTRQNVGSQNGIGVFGQVPE